jgi:UDP-N-acetylglucosamine:LPS N-acetylglucosamine transferase
MMMAAGTGGHVFPALAVAKELQQQGCEVSWLATPTGMENRLLKNHNIPIYQIDIQGVRGNGVVRKLMAPFKILKATLSAMRYMKQLKVDAVAGFGGYVAGPGGLALVHWAYQLLSMNKMLWLGLPIRSCHVWPKLSVRHFQIPFRHKIKS